VLEAFEERIPGVAVFARTACALERVERSNCSTGIIPLFDFEFDNLLDDGSRVIQGKLIVFYRRSGQSVMHQLFRAVTGKKKKKKRGTP
jgi:hypothetical protein